jgi:hypothetical protein
MNPDTDYERDELGMVIVPKFTNREDARAYIEWDIKRHREYEELMKELQVEESPEVYNVSDDMELEIAEANSGRFLDIAQPSLIKAQEEAKKFYAGIDLTSDISLPTLTTTSYVLWELLILIQGYALIKSTFVLGDLKLLLHVSKSVQSSIQHSLF